MARAFVQKEQKRGWKRRAPLRKFQRRELLEKCGERAFLEPSKLKFPVMQKAREGAAGCSYDCQGIQAAYKRAGQYGHRAVQEKALALGKKLGCPFTGRATKRARRRKVA